MMLTHINKYIVLTAFISFMFHHNLNILKINCLVFYKLRKII